MHPLDYFDRVYVINLTSRQDRRDEMTQQLREIGREFGTQNIHLFEASRPDGPGAFPSLGARGCFLSHLRILQDASAQGYGRILILEDDLNFCPNFVADSKLVFDALSRSDWAMFYGGYEALSANPVVSGGLAFLSPTD